MKSTALGIIGCLLIGVIATGCTDRDRELARRTGDGSDTFVYKAPSPEQPVPPALKTPPPAKDGSETFHYKPDRRGLPTPPKPVGR